MSPTTPSLTIKTKILGKQKKTHLPTLRNNQTFSSHATQETTSWVSPPSHQKQLLCKGVELPRPSLLTQKKNPFRKEKNFFSLSSLFLKLHLQLVTLLM
jgi:hypothetical protein